MLTKKLWISAASAALAIGLTAGFFAYRPERKAQIPAQDRLVAVVNNTSIHQSDLSVLSPPASSQEAVGLLVDFTLLDQEAHKKNITISSAEMQQQRRQVIDSQKGMTYANAAKALGRTPAGLDLQLEHAALLHKLAACEFQSGIGKMFHARGILVRAGGNAHSDVQARMFAGKLQQQIQQGADIAALARQYSADPDSAPTGGDFGIIQLAGAPNLVRFAPDFKLQQALARAVSAAAPRSFLNGPLHGDFGYWVVEVVSTSTRPLADAPRYREEQRLWKEMWVRRLEPVVMSKLRDSAEIQPPIAADPAQPTPRTAPSRPATPAT